ncbi:MAG: hypothetical protein N2255_02215, partial [Kiritimatiellae bacterium]|nr:hypothetical protein [Kiritimatiellia bacterium]
MRQQIVWDGLDNYGRRVLPSAAHGKAENVASSEFVGPFKVRVRVGLNARLEKKLGRNPNALGTIMGMAVGSGGELYVLFAVPGPASTRKLVVLDREGRYLRTIMPYSTKTPMERTESVGHLVVEGQRLPIVFSGHAMALYPLTLAMPRQTMSWNPKGHLVAASATDSAYEFGLPRHLLAFHPEGGAPAGVDFVGPELSVPVGLYRGLGRSLYHRFDNLACSPDGTFVYYTGGDSTVGSDYYAQQSRHAVFRFRWDEDKKAGVEEPFFGVDCRPGDGEKYLNNPRGLAVDANGNLYICDRNNNRVVIVSPDAKFLSSFAVEDPEQIAVHLRSGEIYVLTRPPPHNFLRKDHAPMFPQEYQAWRARARARWEKVKDQQQPPIRLLKFSPWKPGSTPRQVFVVEKDVDLMTLHSTSTPTRLWVSTKEGLERICDTGDTFKPDPIAVDRRALLIRPGHLVADPEHNRILVFDSGQLKSVDMRTGEITPFLKGLQDLTRGADGTFYAIRGDKLQKLDADGNLQPFSSEVTEVSLGRFGPHGDPGRSLTVAPNGDLYLMRIAGEKGVQNRVDVYGPDGRLKRAALIDGLGMGDAGIGVDTRGNVYVGVNVKPSYARLPAVFRGKVPEANWLCWVQSVSYTHLTLPT